MRQQGRIVLSSSSVGRRQRVQFSVVPPCNSVLCDPCQTSGAPIRVGYLTPSTYHQNTGTRIPNRGRRESDSDLCSGTLKCYRGTRTLTAVLCFVVGPSGSSCGRTVIRV
jgi:hypothetical protein